MAAAEEATEHAWRDPERVRSFFELREQRREVSADYVQSGAFELTTRDDNDHTFHGIVFNVVWHPVSNGLAASLKSAFKATSVVTFYATIVLLISGYIRSILWMPVADIMYYETPYPDDLLAVVDGITIARHTKHSGHLRDEIGLFNTLIQIYRRPEMLLRITKDKLDITRDKLE